MKQHPNELWLFFDIESGTHKKTRALAKSITKHINEFSFQHNKLSKLRWVEILDMLHMHPKDLLNKANKTYQKELAGHDFDSDSWLEILRNNPDMIKAPIAIMNGKAVLCISPKDIFHLTHQHGQQS